MGAVRVAIILAAGASQRMGTPKALLPWRNVTLLDYAIQQAHAGGADQVIVVLGPATSHVQVNALTVFNPDPETGRSNSIRLASAAVQSTPKAIVVQSVDQPVTAEIVTALFNAIDHEAAEVAIPTYEGRRGHPVCFSGDLLAELQAVTEEEQGLRAVVRRHADHIREVPTESESVVWNLNDPAAFAAAQATL